MIQLAYTTSDFSHRRRCVIAAATLVVACAAGVIAPTWIERCKTYVAEHRRQSRIRAETTSRFEGALVEFEQKVGEGTPDALAGASIFLDQARLARLSNPTVMSRGRLAEWDAMIAGKQAALDAAIDRAPATRVVQCTLSAAACKSPLDDLEATGFRLLWQGRFREAVGVFDQIVVLDPRHLRARVLLPVLRLVDLLSPALLVTRVTP